MDNEIYKLGIVKGDNRSTFKAALYFKDEKLKYLTFDTKLDDGWVSESHYFSQINRLMDLTTPDSFNMNELPQRGIKSRIPLDIDERLSADEYEKIMDALKLVILDDSSIMVTENDIAGKHHFTLPIPIIVLDCYNHVTNQYKATIEVLKEYIAEKTGLRAGIINEIDHQAHGLRTVYSAKVVRGDPLKLTTTSGIYVPKGRNPGEHVVNYKKASDLMDYSLYRKCRGRWSDEIANRIADRVSELCERDVENAEKYENEGGTGKPSLFDENKIIAVSTYNSQNNSISIHGIEHPINSALCESVIEKLAKKWMQNSTLWAFTLKCAIHMTKLCSDFDHNFFLHHISAKNGPAKYDKVKNDAQWNEMKRLMSRDRAQTVPARPKPIADFDDEDEDEDDAPLEAPLEAAQTDECDVSGAYVSYLAHIAFKKRTIKADIKTIAVPGGAIRDFSPEGSNWNNDIVQFESKVYDSKREMMEDAENLFKSCIAFAEHGGNVKLIIKQHGKYGWSYVEHNWNKFSRRETISYMDEVPDKRSKSGMKVKQCSIKTVLLMEMFATKLKHNYSAFRPIPVGIQWRNTQAEFNLFTRFKVQPEKHNWEDPAVWNEIKDIHYHFRDVWCAEGEEFFNWFALWLLQSLFDPINKHGAVPIIVGRPGIGKGYILEWFSRCWFGDSYTHSFDDLDKLLSGFNAHLDRKYFISLNEIKSSTSGHREHDYQKLKSVVADRIYNCEGKGVDAIRSENYWRFIFFMNPDGSNGLREEVHDRRWAYMRASDSHYGDNDYKNKMLALLEGEGGQKRANMYLGYLMSKYNWKDFHNIKMPTSSYKKANLERTMPTSYEYILDKYNGNSTGIRKSNCKDWWCRAELYQQYLVWCKESGYFGAMQKGKSAFNADITKFAGKAHRARVVSTNYKGETTSDSAECFCISESVIVSIRKTYNVEEINDVGAQ